MGALQTACEVTTRVTPQRVGTAPRDGPSPRVMKMRDTVDRKKYEPMPGDANVLLNAAMDEDPDEVACLALEAAKHLAVQEKQQKMGLETDSVYGCAIAMPQIARCAEYDGTFLVLALRNFVFLVLNFSLQLLLLRYIGEAVQIMAPLGGQMHLCDFGANLDKCPNAPHCKGPDGTSYTRTRSYAYTQWAIQSFTKSALLAVFPEKHEEIESEVDPGEYGMDNYSCRLVCIFVFIMSVMEEFTGCYTLARLLWYLPSSPSSACRWIRLRREGEGPEEERKISFEIAGIPMPWKIFSCFFVLLPKIVLCHFVVNEGVVLLMDTAEIMNLVLNSVAMSFILSMDEMVYNALACGTTKRIMEQVEERKRLDDEEDPTPRQPGKMSFVELAIAFFPMRFCFILLAMAVYIYKYYHTKCNYTTEDGWVSKAMYLPLTSVYNMKDFLFDGFFHTVQRESEPFWQFHAEADAT